MVVEELAEHAKLLAERFGDRIDDWGTENEAINYLLAGYGLGTFPPGKVYIFDLLEDFIPVVRDYFEAHAQMYAAIKGVDTVDADGDGVAASVGLVDRGGGLRASAKGPAQHQSGGHRCPRPDPVRVPLHAGGGGRCTVDLRRQPRWHPR